MSRITHDDLKKSGVYDEALREHLISITDTERGCSDEVFAWFAEESRRMLPHFLTNFGTPKSYTDLVHLSHYMAQVGFVSAVEKGFAKLSDTGAASTEVLDEREERFEKRKSVYEELLGEPQVQPAAGAYL